MEGQTGVATVPDLNAGKPEAMKENWSVFEDKKPTSTRRATRHR